MTKPTVRPLFLLMFFYFKDLVKINTLGVQTIGLEVTYTVRHMND